MTNLRLSLADDPRILCTWTDIAKELDASFFALEGIPTQPKPYESVKPVSVGGRNAAWFVEHSLFKGVLRHYRRGGLIGKFIKKSYLWQGAGNTRSWSEYLIMVYLRAHQAPVPRPLAAIYKRCGFFYQAALITEQIEGARTLVEVIRDTAEQDYPELASKVAVAIKQMHELKVNHADLNAFNILLNQQGEVYLIDFDKAKIEKEQGEWCLQNLQRLERHLKKVLGELGFAFMSQISKKYHQ